MSPRNEAFCDIGQWALTSNTSYRTRALECHLSVISDPKASKEDKVGHGVLIWRTIVGDPQYNPTDPEFKDVHWIGIASNMQLIFPEVKRISVQEALAWIENQKGQDWLYEPEELGRKA